MCRPTDKLTSTRALALPPTEIVFEQEDVVDDITNTSVGDDNGDEEDFRTDNDLMIDDNGDNLGGLYDSLDMNSLTAALSGSQGRSSSEGRNPVATSLTLLRIGTLHLEANDYDKADDVFTAALNIFRSLDIAVRSSNSCVEETALKSLGHVSFKRQQYQDAMRFFIEAQQAHDGSPSMSLRVARSDSDQSLVSTQPQSTTNVCAESGSQQSEIFVEARIFRGVGIAHYGNGEYQLALEAYIAALLGYESEVGRNHNEFAELLISIGAVFECLQANAAAAAVYQEAHLILQKVPTSHSCNGLYTLSVNALARQIRSTGLKSGTEMSTKQST